MEGLAADRHILDWDESDVHNWLSSLGYPQYESQIRGIVSPSQEEMSFNKAFYTQNTRYKEIPYAT